jgi:hypothetical protein
VNLRFLWWFFKVTQNFSLLEPAIAESRCVVEGEEVDNYLLKIITSKKIILATADEL